MTICPRSLLAVCLFAASLTAQTPGDFTDGDLYLLSGLANGGSPGILRIDPLSGTTTLAVGIAGAGSRNGLIAYDEYRQRLLFVGTFQLWGTPQLHMLDGLGNHTALPIYSMQHLSPTGDGRVYMSDDTYPWFHYLDSANRTHLLMDASGSAPYEVPATVGYAFKAMTYDPGTNALFLAYGGYQAVACAGVANGATSVLRLPLSADGSRVVGPVDCGQFDVDPGSSNEEPIDFGRGPAGSLTLAVDTNSGGLQAHMLHVDTVSLTLTPWATSSNPAFSAGTYSSSLDKAVLLDTGADVLRAFALGESGPGLVITPSGEVSTPGGSAEAASMTEVAVGGCAGAFVPYGEGLAGSGGAVPGLWLSGCAVPGGVLTIHANDVLGAATGLLLLGSAAISQPFKGGSLLVSMDLPSVALVATGSPGAAGGGTLELPGSLPNDPILSGVELFIQLGFGDTGGVAGVSLSNAVEMEIG